MSILEAYKGGYTVDSGVFSIVNPSIKTEINEYGEYKTIVTTEKDLESVSTLCAISTSSDTEVSIARELYSQDQGINFNKIIGYYNNLYAGHVSEGEYRKNGSSGGMATWILVELLRKKMIDGVIHVKKSHKKPILFEYSISKSEEEIKEGAKSRYYPVECSDALKTLIQGSSNDRFAIVGIPSFIMEIQLLLKYHPHLKKSIPYTIGLVCGHQKSTKYAECIAWECGIKPGDLIDIDFRKKIPFEPANRYITEITGLIDGKTVSFTKTQEELFVSNWGHGFFKKKFSDYSDDAFNETADICVGDAWLPEYTKDSRGNNIVIIRNRVISDIVQDAIQSGRLILEKISEDRIIASQAGLVRHNIDEIGYRLEKIRRREKWSPQKRINYPANIAFLRKRVQDAREKIAISSHIRYREAVLMNNFMHFKKSMQKHILAYRMLYLAMRLSDGSFISLVESIFTKFARRIRKKK